MPMIWHSPSTSRVSNPEIPTSCSPNLVKRMQQERCYKCKQLGHRSLYCPLKSQNTKPISHLPPKHDSSNTVQCRCGHGYCEVKPSRTGRDYYACPIKRGVKCDFFKWCDDPIDERDLSPPPFKHPQCECGAGVCRRVKDTESHDALKYYFACPVKQGHGSCGYRVSEDELLNSKSIVPIQKSRDKTLNDFLEGCQNDKIDNELGNKLCKGDGLHVQIKRMKITNCSGNPSSMAVFEILDKEGSSPMGWLGRLLFFNPTQSLKFPTPQPFFSCVFPSYNPIVVPKQTSIPDGPDECNQLAISSVSQHTQLSTVVSGYIVSPSKSPDGERKSIISKAQWHRELVLFIQQRLLIDLETLDPREHESMREATKITFALLNTLGVDYKQFSDHVLDYINIVSSIAELDKSMENSLTMEEHNKFFEEEKMRFAQLQDKYVKTQALLEASNQHTHLLGEQVFILKAMLHEKQIQLKSCELETLEKETHLGDMKRSMLEIDIKLKERVEQIEVARKQSEERHAKQIAAKNFLEKVKLELKINYSILVKCM